jgi:nucleoside-diphosphate kinase
MALAVRHGKLKRSDVHKEVLDIVDSDMTDKQIKDFTVRESLVSLSDYIAEQYEYTTQYAAPREFKFNPEKHILVVVKPGFLTRTTDIISMYENAGFEYDRMCTKLLTLNEAKRLYYTHRKEDWYKALCEYMASAPCTAILFTYDGKTTEAFKKCDELKDEIREKWSEDDKRNVMHSSDKPEAMQKEASVFFGSI